MSNKKFVPTLKADNQTEWEDLDGKMNKNEFTNFELLQKKVEVLQEQVMEIAKILNQNGLKFVSETEMEDDQGRLDDEVYRRLEKK